jgi:glycosyltransferase involved in cell wall biosynthesis
LFVSVVVPCYRSAGTLPALVVRLLEVMPDATTAYEVVLVVDGSGDETWAVAAGLARQHDQVRAVRLARNYGQHNALVAGIRTARYEVTVTMDDDLQHPPEEIPKLLAALTTDVDLVYGVSAQEEHNFARNATSQIVKAGLSTTLGVRDARQLSAFRAFRTFLRAGFDNLGGPHVSLDVALSWATTQTAVAMVRMDQRTEGRSGYTFRTLMRHTLNMVLGYSVAPLRLVTYVGLLIGAAGLLIVVRLLWLYYQGETTIAGFTTLASLTALFSSAQLISVGVLGEYVGRVHLHGMGRPTYVIRERAGDATAEETVPLTSRAEPVPPRRSGESRQHASDLASQ